MSKSNFDETCVRMIKRILENKSTVRSEVYKQRNPKLYHRLVQTIVENYDVLVDTIRKCKYMQDNVYMGVIKCFQILDGRFKNSRMRRKFTRAMDGVELKITRKPMFVRINALKGAGMYDIETLNPVETSIKDVYRVLSPQDISMLSIYKDGKVVIQNIASCLPAYILNPEEGSRVIDTCSAPGNKTSHLSAIMNNTGKIYAFEMDDGRVDVLRNQLEKLGVRNTEVIHKDFMESSPEELERVRYVLCDPSCSGSGIHLNYKMDMERVSRLRSFQIRMLQHCLKFRPEKLMYSVCSTHKEEGEEVVEEILKNPEYELEDISRFWDSDVSHDFKFSNKIIRCQGNDDTGSIGFFIALFVRKRSSLGSANVE